MGISKGTQSWGALESGPLGQGVTHLTRRQLGYHAEFDRCWSNGIKRTHADWKKKLRHSPFQDHSRSSELTPIDRLPLTFWKRPTVTVVLSCIVFKILDIGRKLLIFTPNPHLMSPTGCSARIGSKTRMIGLLYQAE